MTPAQLKALATLAATQVDRDLARLEALAAEDRRLADDLASLASVHARDMAEGAGAAPLALLGRRLAWADARMAAARVQRARLAAEIAAARAAAATSLGKRRALERLQERAERAAAAASEARAERDAPPRTGRDDID